MMKFSVLLSTLIVCLAINTLYAASWQQDVQRIFGQSGKTENGALKFEYPRSDLTVKVEDVTMRPEFALTTMVSFERVGQINIMTSEIVLLESEAARVISTLRSGGITVAALHNHLLGETPRVLFLHASSRGNPAAVARSVLSLIHI